MADANIDEMNDVRALQEEVRKARRQRDNKSTQGYRGPPPTLDECESYPIFKKKLGVWKTTTCLTDSQQAGVVMMELRDDHKMKKGLATLMFRTLSDQQIANPTMKTITDFLDEQLNLDEYSEIWDLYTSLVRCEIKAGEKYQDFTARFDSSYKALLQKDAGCTISERVLAMMIRVAAKLDSQTLMNVRSNVRWKKQDGTANEDVYKQTIVAINEICAGDVSKNINSHQIKLTTALGEEKSLQYRGDCLYVDGEQMIEMKQHTVLLTQAKGKGPKKMKKKTNTKTPEPKAEAKAEDNKTKAKPDYSKIKCFNCHKYGHFRSVCPEATDEETQVVDEFGEALMIGEVDWSESDMQELRRLCQEDSEDEDEEDFFDCEGEEGLGEPALQRQTYDKDTQGVTVQPGLCRENVQVSPDMPVGLAANPTIFGNNNDDPDNNGDEEIYQEELDLEDDEDCYVDTAKWNMATFTAEARGAAGCDSCCSRTIMGINWYNDFQERLQQKDRDLIQGPFESGTNFLFGNGGKKNSLGKLLIPVSIHGCRANIVAELVDSDIPLLLSKGTMIRAGFILDFVNMEITAFGKKRIMRETTIGHPIVDVVPGPGPEPFQSQVLVTEIKEDGSEKTRKLSDEEQAKVIQKTHKQAGHPSRKKQLQFLKNSSIDWNPKVLKEQLDLIENNCEGCILKKRAPCKPAASIPMANSFNQVVGMDLKIYGDGTIILYIIDFWSKFMQGRIVKSKKPEDIVTAVLECWISHYGCFQATLHDNGGEFIGAAFAEMCDLLGIEDKTGAAHSPWSYGIVEKHHAVVDKTFESLCRDFPKYKKQTLLQWAMTIKNSTTTATGWSPNQVVFGTNPVLPSLVETNPAMMKEEVVSKTLMENFNALNAARIKYNEALADNQVKKMLKAKLRRNQTVFMPGDHIYWKVPNEQVDWRQGKVLATEGKLLIVKYGAHIRRVHSDMSIKKNEEFDKNGKLVTPKEILETQAAQAKKKKRREILISLDETEQFDTEETETGQVDEGDDDAFEDGPGQQQETPGAERDGARPSGGQAEAGTDGSQRNGAESTEEAARPQRTEAESSEEADGPQQTEAESPEEATRTAPPPALSNQNYGDQDGQTSQGLDRANTEVSQSVDRPASNSSLLGTNTAETEDMDTETRRDRVGEAAMIREETRPRKRRAEADTSPKQAAKGRKTGEQKSTGNKIALKKGEQIFHQGKLCTVLGRAGRATGQYYNYFNLQPDSGLPYSIDLQRSEFSKLVEGENQQQMLLTNTEEEQEVLMDIIPYSQHGNQDCVQAKLDEIDKIVNQFNAVEVVKDEGQMKISSRFVLWYKKHSDGSVQTRARLVARGYEEEDLDIPSDSPTLDQLNLKIIMLLAQSEDMELVTVDVKAAFLQGLPLTERTVLVIPPPEAKVPKGHVWRLKVALYGLDDASLRFHWKARSVMTKLGLRQSLLDPALFYERNRKTGEIRGMIGTHVDDFIIGGKKDWVAAITKRIESEFKLGKIERGDYLYCGHRIKQAKGRLTLDQEEFAKQVKPLIIHPKRSRQPDQDVTDTERTQLRAYAGKLGWLGRTTRPDLLVSQIKASSAVAQAKVKDLKELAKAVSKVQEKKSILEIPKLQRGAENWRMEVYTDASWMNLGHIGSMAGKVIVIKSGNKAFPITWSSNKLKRVCHSSMAAEIMAMNEGLKDAQYIREVLKEITGKDVKAELITDCKNAHSMIQATTVAQDKKVRCESAAVREAFITKEVEDIKLVDGKTGQLADCLTKLKTDSSWLLAMVQTGEEQKLGQ